MRIPFLKAHGARNDFLLTWSHEAPAGDLGEIAIAICDRHTGIGADGWQLLTPPNNGQEAFLRLFNSDGSEAEMSGNGTRCAAAMLIDAGYASHEVAIRTGGGHKHLVVRERNGNRFTFEMNMSRPEWREDEVRTAIDVAGQTVDATVLWVGNPQCAVFAGAIPEDWRALGAALERHPRFPKRTNVSFIAVRDRHTIDVRFFERGAGETMSSGTGSTGAAAASILRGLVDSPVVVHTPAGPLDLRWDGGDAFLVGPAEIIGRGEFYS